MDTKAKRKTLNIDPIMGTVLVALIGLFGTGIGAVVGGYFNIKLEKEKLRSNLILKAVETNDPESALNYLKLLRDTRLVTDIDVTIDEWTKDSTLVPLRPLANMAEWISQTGDIRIQSTEELIRQEADNPEMIREVLSSLSEPKSSDGLWNTIVFLNATKSKAYDASLISFAKNRIASFENEVASGSRNLGPKTKSALENYKGYLRNIEKQLYTIFTSIELS